MPLQHVRRTRCGRTPSCPQLFTKFGPQAIDTPTTMAPAKIAENRDAVGQVVDLARREVAAAKRPAAAARGSAVPRCAGPCWPLPVAFFALFFAYPVAAIVGRGLQADGGLAARPDRGRCWAGLRTSGDVLWFTTWQALASTALTLLIALPGAYVFARFDFPGKQTAAGRGDRAVRAADRRRRYGVPGAARARRAARRAVGRTARHDRVGDPARARLLQLRGRRTDRRRALVAARPAAGGGRPGARRRRGSPPGGG